MTDTPATTPPRICACQEVHGFPCQFPDAPAEFKFERLDWCRFHLPLRDSMGNQSDKWLGINGWELEDGVERDAFKLRLVALLSAASQVTGRGNSGEANCKFVAFPHGFNFRTLIQSENKIKMRLFKIFCNYNFTIMETWTLLRCSC